MQCAASSTFGLLADKVASASHRKRCPAAAGTAGVGVLDGEARADQLFGEIDHRVSQERQGDLVDHHLRALWPVDHQIAVGRVVQRDVVLKAGTAAALDRDAQRLAGVGGADLGQAFKDAGGDLGGQDHGVFPAFRS